MTEGTDFMVLKFASDQLYYYETNFQVMEPTEPMILAACSDEDIDKIGISFSEIWSPFPDEIEALYKTLHEKKNIDLQWKCPGRRPLTEDKKPIEVEEPSKPKEVEPSSDDFDFEEEFSTPVQKVSLKSSSLKGSAKKRTTSLAGILSNMERYRRMDKIDGDSLPSTPTSSKTKSGGSSASPGSVPTSKAFPTTSTTTSTP